MPAAPSNIIADEPFRVLLVEDNQGDAELAADQLILSGPPQIKIVHVDRLSSALQALQSDGFDAVLLDLGLPDSTGLASVERLVRQDTDTPVVVLTGLDDEEMGTRAVKAGAQDFLTKGRYRGQALLKSLLYAAERVRRQQHTKKMVARNVDAMVVLNADGTVLFVNAAAEKLFGEASDIMVGRPFGFEFHADRTSEIEIQPDAGAPAKVAQIRVASMEWAGAPAYLASLRDITEIKRAQELERRMFHSQRLASIGQLAAGTAHEINNPAAFIELNLEILADDIESLQIANAQLRRHVALALGEQTAREFERWLSELGTPERLDKMREMLDESLGGIRRVSSTVKELATLSRLDDGDIEMVDVNDVVNVACSITMHQIRHRAQLVKMLSTVPAVAADRNRLIHVVTNLLVNAVQAIKEGAAEQNTIRVETSLRDGRIVVAVSDTGSGIAEHHLAHVFEPFFTTKPWGLGTGLGLAIAAETARRHGGDIRVDSKPGRGSVFEVIIPAETGLKVTNRARPEPEVDSAPMAPGRVLVIDDEEMLRRAIRRALESKHVVAEAHTGEDALKMLDEQAPFDVIICDLQMPQLDGAGLYEKVGERQPELLDRMVFVTGGVFTPRARAFVATHRPVVLQKPIAAAELRAIVDNNVSRRRRR